MPSQVLRPAAAVLALAAGVAWGSEFRSTTEAAVLYDAPSLKSKALFALGRDYPLEVVVNVEGWLKAKADYIQFVRVPIMWGPVHRAHARLYYTLQALGRLDLHEKVFDTITCRTIPSWARATSSR